MIAKICKNHFRCPHFFKKIESIILHFENQIKHIFTYAEIFDLFESNLRILLFLIQKNIFPPEELLYSAIYLYPEIKNRITEQKRIEFDKEFQQIDSIKAFEEKRQIGENDSEICKLIRSDSVVDFIVYISQRNIKVSSQIPDSIYETNSFILKLRTTLIEYAAFFGSIEIFKYLRINKAEMSSSIWLYAIHGRNPEIIHILEEDKIPRNHQKCIEEAIKCHHNEIANYIQDNEKKFDDYSDSYNDSNSEYDYECKIDVPFGIRYYNFEFIHENFFSEKSSFYILCKFGYFSLAKLYLESKGIDQSFLIDIDQFEFSNDYKSNSHLKCVENKETKEKYSIRLSEDEREKFGLEIQMEFKYPCLMELIGYSPIDFVHQDNRVFLYKYYPNGTLESYFKNEVIERSSTKSYILLLGIAIAMRFLEKNSIKNHQFFPSRIFLDENFYPVISDFTFQPFKDVYSDVEPISKEDLVYVAPELFGDLFSDQIKSNVYSYAIMLYQILSGQKPFSKECKNNFSFMKFVEEGMRPDLSIISNNAAYAFLSNCFERRPEERMGFSEIVDFVTNEEFYSYYEDLDHVAVKKFLDIFGDEFNDLKNKF